MQEAEARYLLDIRLHNNSQLSGFTKKGSIEYFTEQLTKLGYVEMPILAPEDEMFNQYRRDTDWTIYEAKYLQLMRNRSVAQVIDQSLLSNGAILLCGEQTPGHCHRRLAVEYPKQEPFTDVRIDHL